MNKEFYMGKIIPDIVPTINRVSLRNTRIIETADSAKRIEGDIYYKDMCIGYYNPIYKNESDLLPRKYIRIEKKFGEIKNFFKDYIPFDRYEGETYDSENVTGFENLLIDLERLNWVSDFIINLIKKTNSKYVPDELLNSKNTFELSEFGDIVPIINGDLIKVIIITDSYKMNKIQIIDFISKNIKGISFNKNYKTTIFRRIEDFNIHTGLYAMKTFKT